MRWVIAGVAAFMLAGCSGAGETSGAPGDTEDTRPFAEISPNSVVRFTGTEPFWGGNVAGDRLVYSTPDNIDGTMIAVERFAGRGGLSFSGELDGQRLDLTITPGECSDGMSDRTYPFVATLQIGEEQRNGCAWREGEDVLAEDAIAAA